jgi:hypothetical protein
MSDLFDTTSLRDDPEHWDRTAERVAGIAARKSRGSAVEWLAHSRTSWVSACFILAVALLSVISQSGNQFAASSSAELAEALAPADDVGRSIVWSDRPPAIGALLLGMTGAR